jgi:hypothetical protein
MHRHTVIAATAAIGLISAVAAGSAGAATHKAKPKPLRVMKGAYTASAVPDPTMEATGCADSVRRTARGSVWVHTIPRTVR